MSAQVDRSVREEPDVRTSSALLTFLVTRWKAATKATPTTFGTRHSEQLDNLTGHTRASQQTRMSHPQNQTLNRPGLSIPLCSKERLGQVSLKTSTASYHYSCQNEQDKISRYARGHPALPVLECSARLCSVTLHVHTRTEKRIQHTSLESHNTKHPAHSKKRCAQPRASRASHHLQVLALALPNASHNLIHFKGAGTFPLPTPTGKVELP